VDSRSSISARATSRSTSGPERDRDVPGGQRAEAGGDAVVRLVIGGQGLDHLAAALDLGLGGR
jgi:hypothetical protein